MLIIRLYGCPVFIGSEQKSSQLNILESKMSHQPLSNPLFVNQSATSTAATNALPLLDISLLNGSETERQEFLTALRHAARDIGFFYLTGHGIDPALLQQIQTLSREFFALPDEEKLAVAMVHSPISAATTVRHLNSLVANPIGANSLILVLNEPHYPTTQAPQVGRDYKGQTSGLRRCLR